MFDMVIFKVLTKLNVKQITFFLLGIIYLITLNSFSQTLKGRVVDIDTKNPLPLASITLHKEGINKVVLSDTIGFFKFTDLTAGRYNVNVRCLGYKSVSFTELLVTNGKQLEISIPLHLEAVSLEEVTVKSVRQASAEAVSIHTLSIEQTNRYASTWGDIARMAMSFAGVNSVNDQSNELVIRGNSPKGLLWMIEGIEVPSPNHFSSEGASGGLISALNTNVLQNSTFYTGAFPANYGNALSGVFDVRLRNGNNEKRESNFTAGVLGIDLGTEGPFSKKHKASYLLNYRFASTELVKRFGLVKALKVALPKFQDITFKVNFPLRKGNVSVWGMGGKNVTDITFQSFVEADSRANFFASGANITIPINKSTSWENILSFSGNETINNRRELSTTNQEIKTSELAYSFLRFSSNLTKKLSPANTIRTGIILNQLNYRLNGSSESLFFINQQPNWLGNTNLNEKGNTFFLQGYILLKNSTAKTTLNTGIHASFFTLNNNYTLEPRINIKHQLSSKILLDIGLGLHSRLEPVSVYLYKNMFTFNGSPSTSDFVIDNKNLPLTQSFHNVVGITYFLNDYWRFHSEIYYQYLYNIGIGDSTKIKGITQYFSVLNQLNSVNVDPLVPKGKGKNYGWEVTIERSLNKGIYCLFTSSIFRSMYSTLAGIDLPSKFDNRFVFNFLAGKEWQIGKNLLNLNIKNTWAGGIRVWPVSIRNGVPVTDYSQGYTSHLPNFYRLDFKINYILNFKKTTSTFSLDINNLTNRSNPLLKIYNPVTKQFETTYQLGLLPVANYRLNF